MKIECTSCGGYFKKIDNRTKRCPSCQFLKLQNDSFSTPLSLSEGDANILKDIQNDNYKDKYPYSKIRTFFIKDVEEQILDEYYQEEDLEENILNDEVSKIIKKIIEYRLTERELKIIKLRFYDEMALEDIGTELDLSTLRVRQIESSAIMKIRDVRVGKKILKIINGDSEVLDKFEKNRSKLKIKNIKTSFTHIPSTDKNEIPFVLRNDKTIKEEIYTCNSFYVMEGAWNKYVSEFKKYMKGELESIPTLARSSGAKPTRNVSEEFMKMHQAIKEKKCKLN